MVSRTLPMLAVALMSLALAPGMLAESSPFQSVTAPTVLVVTRSHRLFLCRDGREGGSYAVSIGRGGTGKRREGDERTPLGRYPLGRPRPSTSYAVFVPVGYPTEAQRHNGYTGGDIGIHGPNRHFAWLGPVNSWFDWTQGCVAVASVREIREIAAWVASTGAARRRHPVGPPSLRRRSGDRQQA